MDLQQRLNAAAAHAVKTRRASGPRTWRREMAEAAGCSYQNIAQASKGEQSTMEAAMLRKIAQWAGVNEDWMVFDTGEMVEENPDMLSGSTTSTIGAPSVTKLVRAPVVAWARLGTDLFKESRLIEADEYINTPEDGSEKCKWFVVDEGIPAYRIKRGYKVALDPDMTNHTFVNDDIYLFRDLDGAMFLAEYRKIAGGFEAVLPSGRVLDWEKHDLKVVAIHRGTWK